MKLNPVKIAAEFVRQYLYAEKWFQDLKNNNYIDAIIITGSIIQGKADKNSDLDIFIIIPYVAECRYSRLEMGYGHTFEGHQIEISFVTTEKLLTDQVSKSHAHWWQDCAVIEAKPNIKKAIRRAGSFSVKEKADFMWSYMVLYEIELTNLGSIFNRGDTVSFYLSVAECIKNASGLFLLEQNITRWVKWHGLLLSKYHPEVHEIVKSALHSSGEQQCISHLCQLRPAIKASLQRVGFDSDEIDNWSSSSPRRLTFQRY